MNQTFSRRSKRDNFEKGFPNLHETHVLTMPSHQQQQHLLNIETCVLKVNVNCNGCHRKVQKVLRKIEGVFAVSIDAEQQRVTVKGIVNPSTLIKKLAKSGKHAEIWSKKTQQKGNNQEQHSQNKGKNIDQLIYPNLLGVGDGPGRYELNAKEMENLLKDISGNAAYASEGNYQNDIGNMMQMMGINEQDGNHRHHQGYDFGASVKNNYQQFQNYPAGLAAYGYHQHPSQAMMPNLMGSQYNQNPYAAWLTANPQNMNMQAIMNNRRIDEYLNM